MSKTLELVFILFLLLFSFIAGVVYSSDVKSNFDWLFEVKEQELEVISTDEINANQNILEEQKPIENPAEIQVIEKTPEVIIPNDNSQKVISETNSETNKEQLPAN